MTHKLLAVDDSKTMRKVLEITFGGEGFAATICGSASDALAEAKNGAPSIALIDGGLPGSYDLIRDLKSVAPSTKVLVLSSKHRPYDDAQGSAVGADGNFDKPFDSQKLIDRINQLVAGAPAAAPPAAAPRPVAAPTPSAAPRPVAPAATPAAAPPIAAPTPSPAAVAPRPAAPQSSVGPRPAAPAPSVSMPARSAPVAAAPVPAAPVAAAAPTTAKAGTVGSAQVGAMGDKLKDLGLTAAQIEGVLSLSRTVVEQVVWEVVPVLAETLIREEIARLTAD